jgi:glucose/arabinose dehydrogenase
VTRSQTAAASAGAATAVVHVTLSDFSIHLSTATVRPGGTVFVVTNRGNLSHAFAIDTVRTRTLAHGARQRLSVVLGKVGAYRFSSTLPGQSQLGMTGVLHVRRGLSKPVAEKTTSRLRLTTLASGLGALTFAVSPPGDDTRLMVTQQNGLILLFKSGVQQSQPFADLRSVVMADGEKGLLSLAFAPDYQTSGRCYVYYNNRRGDIRVVELHRSAANPDVTDSTRRRLLAITKQAADHNGGMMQFGPDGFLYIAIGDGGADPPAVPVGAYGQTTNDLFGSIIRIDPGNGSPYAIPAGNPFANTPDVRPEIVAYGLRNPWRFWIDPGTNTMLIGDVGEGEREEIDQLPLDQLGLDFGWPCKEGSVVPPEITIPASCATAKLTPPLYEYPHGPKRCSIIGGVISHDPGLRALDGLYLWTDLCDGHIYGLTRAGGHAAVVPLDVATEQPSSFGTDADGGIYVTTATGSLLRLELGP